VNALAQTFMSIGIAYGCFMGFANSPFVRDALCILALNSLTSLVVCIIAFAAMGHTAHLYDVPLHSVVTEGIASIFIFLIPRKQILIKYLFKQV